jgi:hypothetical protein
MRARWMDSGLVPTRSRARANAQGRIVLWQETAAGNSAASLGDDAVSPRARSRPGT